TVVTSSILWDYFTLLWPVSFGENWYGNMYAGHSPNHTCSQQATHYRLQSGNFGLLFEKSRVAGG
ncbi:hypothetical protein, partial [Desulfovibrio piger]|uniref:hypothetical protein n=1 Tax=Desulfovibrio piger TaxID=901 RepID=UPI0019817A41